MPRQRDPASAPGTVSRIASLVAFLRTPLLATALLGTVAVDPVLAQSSVESFCDTDMAATIENLFRLIQFGGPLVGGVVALGATVAIPTVRRSDLKKELKETRNQAIIWGVLVAPLGTAIIGFLLNNIVVGGASCGF